MVPHKVKAYQIIFIVLLYVIFEYFDLYDTGRMNQIHAVLLFNNESYDIKTKFVSMALLQLPWPSCHWDLAKSHAGSIYHFTIQCSSNDRKGALRV